MEEKTTRVPEISITQITASDARLRTEANRKGDPAKVSGALHRELFQFYVLLDSYLKTDRQCVFSYRPMFRGVPMEHIPNLRNELQEHLTKVGGFEVNQELRENKDGEWKTPVDGMMFIYW